MAYVSGTRTLQNNSAEDLYAQIAAALTSHANWTFIEDYSTAAQKWSVWRCGTLNSTGFNFFVLFNRTLANSTTLNVGLCEDYDSVTHTAFRAAPVAVNTARTPAADMTLQGGTGTVLPNSAGVSPQIQVFGVTLDASSYDYWFVYNNDGFWLGARVGTNAAQGVICSTFDSLVDNPATNDPRPVILGSNVANSTTVPTCVTTRHPLVTASTTHLWGMSEWWTSTFIWPGAAALGSVGTLTGDLFQGSKAVGTRVVVRTWGNQRSVATTAIGANRGLFRHILYYAVAAGVTVGDTITVGGATYVYTGKGVFYNASAA